LEIKKVKKLSDFRHLNLFEIEYVDMHQKERTWQLASRMSEPKCVTGDFSKPDAVVIVPFHTKKNKLVIIKEFRVPLGDYQYGFPAGLMDEGETIEQTAIRELHEETGLTVTQIKKSTLPAFSTSGLTDESVSMVYVECEGTPTNIHNESSEDITTLMVSPSEAETICQNPQLKIDIKTSLILSFFAEMKKI